jgi:hypothetical protein
MTGAELRAYRERLGVGVGELADRAKVKADDLRRWEDSRVPWWALHKVDRALWELELLVVGAQAESPSCGWMEYWERRGEAPDVSVLDRHIRYCPTCQARDRYLWAHVRPWPLSPWVAWMPAWLRSALFGAVLATCATGAVVGAAILLILGASSGDANLIAGGGGVLVIGVAAGAAAGLVHFVTGRLRRSPRLRLRALAWTLTVEVGLAVAVGLLALGGRMGVAGLSADEASLFTHPLFLSAVAAAGVVGGVASAVLWL